MPLFKLSKLNNILIRDNKRAITSFYDILYNIAKKSVCLIKGYTFIIITYKDKLLKPYR